MPPSMYFICNKLIYPCLRVCNRTNVTIVDGEAVEDPASALLAPMAKLSPYISLFNAALPSNVQVDADVTALQPWQQRMLFLESQEQVRSSSILFSIIVFFGVIWVCTYYMYTGS